MPPVYLLTAAQVPLVQAPVSVLDPAAGLTRSAERIVSGTTALEMSGLFNHNAARLDNLGAYGGGGRSVAVGRDLSGGTGLTLNVSAGLFTVDSAHIYRAAEAISVADNLYDAGDITVRGHIWQSPGAPPTVRTNLTPPATPSAYLGSVRTSGGAFVDIDYSGRLISSPGMLYRRTADLARPGDTPSAAVKYWHRSVNGLYFWDGADYINLTAEGYLAKSVAGGANVTLTQPEYEARTIVLTGLLTANVDLVLPLSAGRRWLVHNRTTGAFTVRAIGSAGTGILLPRSSAIWIWSDGTNILSEGQHGRLLKTLADADATLSAQEYAHRILQFGGALTADRVITLPALDGAEWTAYNATTGGFNLTFMVAGGSGVVVAAGKRRQLYGDGTDIRPAGPDV